MDTSVEYIMMCQRASELQSSWNPARGDFLSTRLSYCDECSKSCMCKDCARMTNIYVVSGQYDYHESIGGTHWFFGGHACVRGGGNIVNDSTCYVMTRNGLSGIYDQFDNSSVEEKIWLPRQDQLQQMFLNGLTKQAKVRSFIKYLDTDAEYNAFNDSLESLWLSFYVKEKYNKKWNRISNIMDWEEIE